MGGKEGVEVGEDVGFGGVIFVDVVKDDGGEEEVGGGVVSRSGFGVGGGVVGVVFLVEGFEVFEVVLVGVDGLVEWWDVVGFWDVGGGL